MPSAWTATRWVRWSSPRASAHPTSTLISLLAINRLRISEALGADIDALGIARGHRTLTVLRKGGKIVTIPLAPRTARATDLAIRERLGGPISAGLMVSGWTATARARSCAESPAAPESTSR
jgi:integrase